jgi:predicted transcriptional regulator
MESSDLIALTADIVSAHVSNNNVSNTDLPGLIASVHAALVKTETPPVAESVAAAPAVPIRSSVKQDYIVCLEDGKKLKMLKRYLRTNYNMSPEDYRAKWGLPRDYPMVAPAYAEQRRGLAKQIGLGRKKLVETAAPIAKAMKARATRIIAAVEGAIEDGIAPAPKPRGRPAKPKAAADAAAKPKTEKKPRGIAAAKAAAQEHLTGSPVPGPSEA